MGKCLSIAFFFGGAKLKSRSIFKIFERRSEVFSPLVTAKRLARVST